MTSTALTQEAIRFAENNFQMMVNAELLGSKVLNFLLKNRIEFKPGNIDNAMFVSRVEKNTGTVGTIDANGVPTGVDFMETRTPYEETKSFTQLATVATIKMHNIPELQALANTLATSSNAEMVAQAFRNLSFANIIQNEMTSKLINEIRDRLTSFLIASESATIYGSDTMFSASAGTLWAGINKISGTFSETTFKEQFYRQAIQKDVNGVVVGSDGGLDTIFVENAKYYDVTALINPEMSSNVDSRIMIPKADVIPLTLTTSDCFALGKNHGLRFISDTPFPIVFMKEDENGNMLIHARWNVAFVWVHRLDAFMYNNA